MEPMTLLTTATGYVLKGVANSKVAQVAKEEVLDGFWRWVRPYIIPKVPEVETVPDEREMVEKVQVALEELSADQEFLQALMERVAALEAAGVQPQGLEDQIDARGSQGLVKPNKEAIDLWQRKIEFLQKEEVLAEGNRKFVIQEEIRECELKIQELGGEI